MNRAESGIRDFHLPPIEEFQTASGLPVLLAPRGKVPLVAIRLAFRSGSAADPPGKRGLADFTAGLLRRGTRGLTAEQLDDAVESVGGSLNTAAAEDFLTIKTSSPSEPLASMLRVLARLVEEPSFPPREVATARNRLLSQIANDMDDPAHVAARAIGLAIWDSHPYAHSVVGVASDVASFTRSDLVRFHRQRIGPQLGLLAIVGNFSVRETKREVEKAFARWGAKPIGPPSLPPRSKPAAVGEALVIDKPEQTQTQVRIGGLAFPRGHPDFFPAELLETVFGGVFTSRLMQAIRVDRGLSYGASSSFDPLLAGGTLTVSTFTKTETTREILEVALGEAEKLRRRAPSRKELDAAKTYLSGLFPLRLETNEALAGMLLETRIYNLGDDWVSRYRSRLREVTPEQVRHAAGKYFDPEGFTYALVGNASAIAKQLRDFSRIRILRVSDLQ